MTVRVDKNLVIDADAPGVGDEVDDARNVANGLFRSPAPSRELVQQSLQSERERIRRIESTLSDLVQELAAELLASEERLQQVESQLESVVDAESQTPKRLFRDDPDDEAAASGDDAASASRRVSPDELAAAWAEREAELRAEFEEKLAAARQSLADAETEQEELRRQVAKGHKQLNLRAQELNELRAQLAGLSVTSCGSPTAAAESAQEMMNLRAERQLLVERLADAESRLQQFDQIDLGEVDSLRHRFEMAVQDVRELKVKNSQLEQELSHARKGVAPGKARPAVAGGGGLDWEAQKRMILAQLESDGDESPSRRQERATIASTLRITDDVVAQKEQQIAELRRMLSEQSDASNARDDAAAAVDLIVDKDEIILRQRETLRRLEAELREKLCRTEIELSVERAKLARERTLLDDKRRAMTQDESLLSDKLGPPSGERSGERPGDAKPGRGGRWLARLGLKDDKA